MRASSGQPVDVVRHAQFAAAIPDLRSTVLVEDGLIPAVHRHVVDHVVGDDEVRVALDGYRPAGSQRGDLVAAAVHQQCAVVAVDRLLDAATGEVGIALDVVTDDNVAGALTQVRVSEPGRLRMCTRNSDGHC